MTEQNSVEPHTGSRRRSIGFVNREKRAASNPCMEGTLKIGEIDGKPKITTGFPKDSPIQYFQLGKNGQTLTMDALIEKKHLGTGSGTNQKARDKVKDEGHPVWRDHAGHILANILGGSGTDLRNIFPQSPQWNTGFWRTSVEKTVRDEVLKWGSVHFTVNLRYVDETYTRPREIGYCIRQTNNRLIKKGIFPNNP